MKTQAMLPSNSNIHCIINPVSGSGDAPLQSIGNYLAHLPYKTTIHFTRSHHTVHDCVSDALNDNTNLIIVYGGDGTVMEAANALHSHDIALAILPGGTANVIAHELDIPTDIEKALQLIFEEEHHTQWIDAGKVNDDYFLLRLSIGWDAELSLRPTSEEKSKFGTLAYTQAALKALNDLDPILYTITLDDGSVETVEGINCSICNIGNVGFYDVRIGSNIEPDDGLLNILVLQSKRIKAIRDIAQNILATTSEIGLDEVLPHYKAKRVTISASSQQRMSIDGEGLNSPFPITIDCIPRYVSIVVPNN